jgi:hypothetical protein
VKALDHILCVRESTISGVSRCRCRNPICLLFRDPIGIHITRLGHPEQPSSAPHFGPRGGGFSSGIIGRRRNDLNRRLPFPSSWCLGDHWFKVWVRTAVLEAPTHGERSQGESSRCIPRQKPSIGMTSKRQSRCSTCPPAPAPRRPIQRRERGSVERRSSSRLPLSDICPPPPHRSSCLAPLSYQGRRFYDTFSLPWSLELAL